MLEKNLNTIQELLKPIKAFILDMDGTIYLGNDLFSCTHPFLNKVKDTNRDYYFFTNNSSKSLQVYLDKLDKMDIHITEEQMMVSTHVIMQYLKDHHPGETVYIVGTPALLAEFQKHGFEIDETDPDIIILGFDTTLTYEKLEKACTWIRHGKTYYGINPDLNCPIEGGEFIPDCGSMAKLIEASTGRYPEFFGKPSHRTLDYIVEKTGLQPNEIAIIGDRLYTDIAVADQSEVTSILVLSGETTEKDVETSDIKPDIIVQDIGVLVDLL